MKTWQCFVLLLSCLACQHRVGKTFSTALSNSPAAVAQRKKDSLDLRIYWHFVTQSPPYTAWAGKFVSQDSLENRQFFDTLYNSRWVVFFREQPPQNSSYGYKKAILCYYRCLLSYEHYAHTYEKALFQDFALRHFLLFADRSPQALAAAFKRYKPFLYQSLTKNHYQNLEVGEVIEELLEAKAQYKHPTYTRIYDSLLLRDAVIDFPQKRNQGIASVARNWYYSFWYRRHLEGNVEATAQILREIQAHYKGL